MGVLGFVQGFPPMQVAPMVEHLHAGYLSEVTPKGWHSGDGLKKKIYGYVTFKTTKVLCKFKSRVR